MALDFPLNPTDQQVWPAPPAQARWRYTAGKGWKKIDSTDLETPTQAEAEAGISSVQRLWTSERVRQSTTAWWSNSTTAFGRSLVNLVDANGARIALGLSGSALLPVGTTANTVAAGNDPRFTDARTPTSHNQAWSTITATPTTLTGYGITDGLTTTAAAGLYQPLNTNLTSLSANAVSYYLNRANHTGTQSAATITGLSTVATTGAYSDLTGLPTQLVVGTTLGTVAAGNDSRIVGALSAATAATIYLTQVSAAANYQPLSANLTGLSANAASFYLNRANHTGTQAANSITGLSVVATSGSYADLTNLPALGTAAFLAVATSGNASSTQVVKGDDTRLSDARTPLGHNQAWSTITATPTTLSGYGITDAQPLDADLTAIAALSTTAFGRSFLDRADATAGRTLLGLGGAAILSVGTTVGTVAAGNDTRFTDARTPLAHNQAWSTITATPTTLSGYGIVDSQPLNTNLTSISALTTTAFGRSFLDRVDAAAGRTLLELGSAATSATTAFAPAAQGVDGGDAHDHFNFGVQIDYQHLLGLPDLGTASSSDVEDFAPANQGVTNGNNHDHSGGDGAAIAFSSLTGRPTTLSGYGITDGLTTAAAAASYQPLNANLTSLSANTPAFYLARANHTGTQAAGTITGLATVATSGAYTDLSGRPTLGGAAGLNVGTTVGTVAAGDDTRITGALSTASAAATYQPLNGNLTSISALTTTTFGLSFLDRTNAAQARGLLELGNSSTRDVGTTAGTVAAGDDPRFSSGGGGGGVDIGLTTAIAISLGRR